MTIEPGNLFAATLCLEDIMLTKAELAEALGLEVDVFKPQRSGNLHHAGICLPLGSDSWFRIADALSRLGPVLARLSSTGRVGQATLDIAFGFDPSCVTRSAVIPSLIAGLAGRCGIDVEVSTYPVEDNCYLAADYRKP